MTEAVKAETLIAFVPEVTINTTPATPSFVTFRGQGESIAIERSVSVGSELNGRRGLRTKALNYQQGSGGFSFEYSEGLLDLFLESVLRGAWAANVLVDASVPKSFTLETLWEQGATDTIKRLTGAEVSTVSLNMRAKERITGEVAFLARGSQYTDARIAGATYAAGSTEPVQVGGSVSGVALSGITLGCVPSLSLNINTNLAAEHALNGSLDPCTIYPGTLEISGSIAVILNAAQLTLLDTIEAGGTTSLEFYIGTSVGDRLKVELPVIVFDGHTANSDSSDGLVMVEANFKALQASTLSNSVIRCTRAA